MSFQDANPHEIVARGEEIYNRKYRAEFERLHDGEFVAIDTNSEAVYLADRPEDVLSKARIGSPNGVFYLLRIGASGAFKSTRMSHSVANSGVRSLITTHLREL
jgi:hypothetical protein